MMRRRRAVYWQAITTIIGLGACGPAFRAATEPEGGSCRTGDVSFYVPEGESHQSILTRWCAGVGPAVYLPQRSAESDVARITSEREDSAQAALPVADSVLVVAWNNHVGGGALERFVDDLREGRLTNGDSVHHFVLLLQEVYRSSSEVPELSSDMLYASGIDEAPLTGARTDIAEWGAAHPELAVLYAPSMRNGPQAGATSRQDRGSAIVSSLPLSDPVAYERSRGPPCRRRPSPACCSRWRAASRGAFTWPASTSRIGLTVRAIPSAPGWSSSRGCWTQRRTAALPFWVAT